MMEGKWFADSVDGVRLHATNLYPDGNYRIVATEVPDQMLEGLYRDGNLDPFGPATYLESNDLEKVVPILEPDNLDR
jgi:hypothetical protein